MPSDSNEPGEIIESTEHHCVVMVPEWWMCEDCGASFARDPSWGDFPEECIIEGTPCVVYIAPESDSGCESS